MSLHLNKGGFAETTLLIAVIVGLIAFFVPNPISSSVGVGIRPNKTVQTEKVELIKDAQGNPIAYKTIASDKDIQQRVGFFEWLRSLPVLVLLLMGLGVVFLPIAFILNNAKAALVRDTKKIVVGVDKALSKVSDPSTKQVIYDEMEKTQDQSTKDLVDKIQGKK